MRSLIVDRVTIVLIFETAYLTAYEITKRLETAPDKQWGIGDPYGKRGMSRKLNGWCIEETATSSQIEEDPDKHLIPVVAARFEERVRKFLHLVPFLDQSVEKDTILIFLAHEVPGIELAPSFLEVVSGLGSGLQIDAMIYGDDDGQE